MTGELDEFQFQPGDIIQDYEKPVVKVLNYEHKDKRCTHCFTLKDPLLRCSGCKMVCYCDKKCQKRDWKSAHSIECKSNLFKNPLTRVGGIPVDVNLTSKVLRILAHLKLNPESATKTYKMYDGTLRCFNDLIPHELSVQQNAGLSMFCQTVAMKLKDEDGLFTESECDVKYLHRLIGIWRTNAFEMLNDSDTVVTGSGIYIQAAGFDHACRPTALRVSDTVGCRMQIRCIGPIPKGAKPRITYLAGTRTREERQKILRDRYDFQCDCELCEEEKNGPATDYENLNMLKPAVESVTNYRDGICHMREDVISLLQKLYHDHDERISNFCNLTAQAIIHSAKFTKYPPDDVVKKTATDNARRLEITFGTEHKDYESFMGQFGSWVVSTT